MSKTLRRGLFDSMIRCHRETTEVVGRLLRIYTVSVMCDLEVSKCGESIFLCCDNYCNKRGVINE